MSALPQRELNRLAKQRRILDAALSVFAAEGYSGTSMDAIAAKAAVSKPTLYQYFGTKEQLFTEIMLAERNTMLLAFDHPGTDMVAELHHFAWHYADTVMRPEFLSLARLIIGEVQRFPEIGRAYQASGPDHLLRGIMRYLDGQRRAGRLSFEDSELAAQDLWGLILSAPRTQALYMPDTQPDRATLQRYILNGLRVFLKAYSTAPGPDIAQLEARTRAPSQQVIHDA